MRGEARMTEKTSSGDTAAGDSSLCATALDSGSGPAATRPVRGIQEKLKIRPMEAVRALYAEGETDLAEAIFSSLGRAIFEGNAPPPASLVKRVLARVSYRVLKRTTRRNEVETDDGGWMYRNRLLERSGHPYAAALLASSCRETGALVEGGDPMNGPYMMIAPEIREACTLWDKLFCNSVQSKDVQLRFIWETRATVEEASQRLSRGLSVRLKALAAGTGLSMLLAYDQLLRRGHDPSRIDVAITDRDPVNTAKTERLLAKLACHRGWRVGVPGGAGVAARTEDIFAGDAWRSGLGEDARHDLVTAVGILEYLQGFTLDTTEKRLNLIEPPEEVTARDLAARLCAMTRSDGSLIINTFRPHFSTRIMELFGKRFDYRDVQHVTSLMAETQFRLPIIIGSGLIYDVKVFRKQVVVPGLIAQAPM